MKILTSIIFLSTLAYSYADDTLTILAFNVNGKSYAYEYPLSKIERLPVWDASGETPIPFKDALKKAWHYVKKQYPDEKLSLNEVELNPRAYLAEAPSNVKKICWVYHFKFHSVSEDEDFRRIILLMDGTVLAPRVSERR